jgi:hypothetical protein
MIEKCVCGAHDIRDVGARTRERFRRSQREREREREREKFY